MLEHSDPFSFLPDGNAMVLFLARKSRLFGDEWSVGLKLEGLQIPGVLELMETPWL